MLSRFVILASLLSLSISVRYVIYGLPFSSFFHSLCKYLFNIIFCGFFMKKCVQHGHYGSVEHARYVDAVWALR